jgi:hypothetical protein
MNIKNAYLENEKEKEIGESKYTEPSVSINFEPKQEYQNIPENAEIYEKRILINVKEIENGYISEMLEYIEYEIAENENKTTIVNRKCTFSNQKPNHSLNQQYSLA